MFIVVVYLTYDAWHEFKNVWLIDFKDYALIC